MHQDDLAGRLIEMIEAGGDRRTIIRLPAVAEAHPIEALDRTRANMLARNWSALYQQRTTPDEGEMFAPDHMGSAATPAT